MCTVVEEWLARTGVAGAVGMGDIHIGTVAGDELSVEPPRATLLQVLHQERCIDPV